MRKPHQPRPPLGVAGDDHQLEIAGAVIHRQRAQQRPHQRMQFGHLRAHEAEPGAGAQAQNPPDVANPALLQHEVAQRPSRHRFEFLSDRHLGPLQRYPRVRGRGHADTEAYVEEVRIAGTALPHPRSADDGVESLRVGVDERLTLALLPRGALDLFAVLVELAQIAAALLLLLTPADPPATAEPAAEHQRPETDQPDQWEKPGLQRAHAGPVHDDQGPEDADQQHRRGDHQQNVARLTFGQCQRRRDRDPHRRRRRHRGARSADEPTF